MFRANPDLFFLGVVQLPCLGSTHVLFAYKAGYRLFVLLILLGLITLTCCGLFEHEFDLLVCDPAELVQTGCQPVRNQGSDLSRDSLEAYRQARCYSRLQELPKGLSILQTHVTGVTVLG